MASHPRIGTRLRRAIERKYRSGAPQADLARDLGVSRSAVNAWVNDRTYPRNAIGALEELLDVDLTSDEPRNAEVYTDPAERAIEHAILEDESVPQAEKRELISELITELRDRRHRQQQRLREVRHRSA